MTENKEKLIEAIETLSENEIIFLLHLIERIMQ
jgi:hypothetical protein